MLSPVFHQGLGWTWEPSVVVGLAIVTLVYGALCYVSGKGMPWWQQLCFHLGTLVVAIALLSPLDGIADSDLFSIHMLQHVLITFVSPPLWLVGISQSWSVRVQKNGSIKSFLGKMGNPVFAFLFFNGVMWAWHWPAAYDLALSDERIHIVEHIMFIGSSIIGWLPIFGHLLPKTKQLALPIRALYAIAMIPACTSLAALITFSGTPLYVFYGLRSLEWGLNPMLDQAIGGLIMWMPTDIIFLSAALWLFNKWLSHSESPNRAHHRILAA